MKLKPASPDLQVPHPAGGYLAAAGEDFPEPLPVYWWRRIYDGSVVRVEAPQARPATRRQTQQPTEPEER